MQEEELGRVGGRTDHKVRQLLRAQRCVGVAAGARVERGRGGQRVRVVLDDGRCARPDSGVHGRSWGGVLERGGEVAEPAAGGHGRAVLQPEHAKSAKRFSGSLLGEPRKSAIFGGKSRSRKSKLKDRHAPAPSVWVPPHPRTLCGLLVTDVASETPIDTAIKSLVVRAVRHLRSAWAR